MKTLKSMVLGLAAAGLVVAQPAAAQEGGDEFEQSLGLPVLAELSQQSSVVTRWWRRLRLFRRPKTLEFAT